MTIRRIPVRGPRALLATTFALLLAACGGGGHGPEPVAEAVPAEAAASPAAFTHFVASLAADDRREPLPVDGLVPPTSETAEPQAVER